MYKQRMRSVSAKLAIFICGFTLIISNVISNYASSLSGPFRPDRTLPDLGFILIRELPWGLQIVDSYIFALLVCVLTSVFYSGSYDILTKVSLIVSVTHLQRW